MHPVGSALLTCLPQVCHGKRDGFERMQLTRSDTTQHCHRLAPQDRRPRRRPEGPRSGWPIPPVRSDLVGEADQLLAVAQPVRSAPPTRLFDTSSCRSLTARAARSAGAFAFSTGVTPGCAWRRLSPRSITDHRNGPGSSPPNSPSQNRPPALPVNHIHNNPAGIPAYREVQVILKEPHARGA